MASQDARLSKFEADFKQQQSEMTNKIDTILKAITDRITGALPSDMVKNPKLNVNPTSPVLSALSFPTKDPQYSTRIHSSINSITIYPKQLNKSLDDKSDKEEEEKANPKNINTTPPSPLDPSFSFITEKVRKLNLFLESSGVVPQSSYTKFVCTKEDDGDVMFIEIIMKYDDSHEKELEVEVNAMTEGLGVEYFDTFPTRSELAYHKKFFKKNECEVFIEAGDGVRIIPNSVRLYLMRRSLEVLREFPDDDSWMTISHLSQVSSPLLRKPREY
ncbi:hypothetical protein Tco_0170036 [Tanacetum coccineum]